MLDWNTTILPAFVLRRKGMASVGSRLGKGKNHQFEKSPSQHLHSYFWIPSASKNSSGLHSFK